MRVIVVFVSAFDALFVVFADFAHNFRFQPCFFFDFSDYGLLDGFAGVYSSAGECPVPDEGRG